MLSRRMAIGVILLIVAATGSSCPAPMETWVLDGTYAGTGQCEITNLGVDNSSVTSTNTCASYVHFTDGQIDKLILYPFDTIAETLTHVGQTGQRTKVVGDATRTMDWEVTELEYGPGSAVVKINAVCSQTTPHSTLEGPIELFANFLMSDATTVGMSQRVTQDLTLRESTSPNPVSVNNQTLFDMYMQWTIDLPDSVWP